MARREPTSASRGFLDAGRERLTPHDGESAEPFLRILLVGAFAVSVALFIGALSARQLSQRDNALPILEASVRALTDPERLVAAELEGLRSEASERPSDGITVPGFPLDVALNSDEVRDGTPASIADLLVERGAVLIYGQGMDSFDRTGNQQSGLFSAQGLVKRISARVTSDAHSTANTATAVLLVITTLLAVTVVLVYREDRRLRALGVGLIVGGVVGAVGCAFLGFLTNSIGGSDPFTSDVRDIVHTVLDVPERNFAIVGILGVFVTATSLLLRFGLERGEPNAVDGPPLPAYETADYGDEGVDDD